MARYEEPTLEKRALSAAASAEHMVKSAAPTPGEEAAANAGLAQAYATLALFGEVAELKTIVNDRLAEVSNFLDAIVTAIRTHD